MAKYLDGFEDRYLDDIGDVIVDREDIGRTIIVREDTNQLDQVTTDQVTANQDNYPLPPNEVVIFTTDASRNFTGFVMSRTAPTVFCNGGSFDGVIVNNSGSSEAENRVLCHTGANITLGPNESAILFYDVKNSRVRTVGF